MVGPDGRHIRGFAHGAVVRTWSDDEMKHQTDVQPYLHLPELVERFYAVGEWTIVDHHRAHATGAYEASPFRSALVVSFDGGGNDGAFLAYYASRGTLTKLATLDYNFGEAYTNIAEILPEVAGTRAALDFFCNATRAAGDARAAGDGGVEFFDKPEDLRELKGRLGFAGKLMGFAAAGTARDELLLDLYDWFEESAASQGGRYSHLPRVYGAELQRVACADGSPEALRDVAATAQLMFERFVVDIVGQLLAHVGGAAAVDGVDAFIRRIVARSCRISNRDASLASSPSSAASADMWTVWTKRSTLSHVAASNEIKAAALLITGSNNLYAATFSASFLLAMASSAKSMANLMAFCASDGASAASTSVMLPFLGPK